MKKKTAIYRSEDGCSKVTRINPDLDPSSCKLYGLSMADHIALILQLAEQIPYFNHHNIKEGNWKKLLVHNESILMLQIEAMDADKITDEFFNLYYTAKTGFYRNRQELQHYKAVLQFLVDIVQQINTWYNNLLSSKRATSILEEMQSIIQTSLQIPALDLQELTQENMVLSEAMELQAGAWFKDLSVIWKRRGAVTSAKDVVIPDFRNHIRRTKGIFDALINAIRRLQAFCSSHRTEAMQQPTHEPHIAMLLTFLHLFEHNQGHLNGLVKKHLDYYYNEVLKLTPLSYQPDKVFVSFQPAPHITEYIIPAGTALSAGKYANNEDVLFITQNDLQVNQVVIDRINTLFVSKNPRIHPATKDQIVTQLYCSQIDYDKTIGEDMFWPAFGLDEQDSSSLLTQKECRIGFAVSSPVLLMQEGAREVQLSINFNKATIDSLQQLLQEIATIEKISGDDAFFKVFERAFLISVTTDSGWHSITDYMVTFTGESNHITDISISLYLDSGYSPVVGYDDVLHNNKADTFTTVYPVLKIAINPNNALYPYSFLHKLVIEQIKITVQVTGLQNFSAVNQHGPLNTVQPFFPFGNQPGKGSYFLIGQKEVFYKKLESLSLDIEWQSLPQDNFGFTEYYYGYPEKIVNESFACTISVLKKGQWMPQTVDQQKLILFQSVSVADEDPDYSLRPVTPIHYIDINKLQQPAETRESYTGQPEFSNETLRGFIKLELCSPEMGFGAEVYPTLLAEAILKKHSKKTKGPVIQKPYTPVINKLNISYTASAIINFTGYAQSEKEGNVFYHLYPFGNKKFDPHIQNEQTYIIPPYYFEGGHMFIGLKNLQPPQTVSLLFQLLEKGAATVTDLPDMPLAWTYLKNNNWEPIPPRRLLKDGTNHLTQSGIITLEVPADITMQNTIMPGDCYWIRLTRAGNNPVTTFLSAIYPQAALAIRQVTPEATANNQLLPALTIKNLRKKVAAIATVKQPFTSFSGRALHQKQEDTVRMAERLRHKQRASSCWDFEHMVLDKFPDIFKVQCIASNEIKTHQQQVNIVVFPDVQNNNRFDMLQPRFSNVFLHRVKNWLQQYLSPFCKLQVINPHYETLKVFTNITAASGYNSGFYTNKISNAITQFLSPWIVNNDYNIQLGASLDVITLASWLNNIDYIEQIDKLSVVKVAKNSTVYTLDIFTQQQATPTIQPLYPWSLLTSANRHNIVLTDSSKPSPDKNTGLDFFAVSEEFIITQ
ncbi:MAG: hypothetical protein QM731_19240 [Chitinophagaceae bacterium]